MTKTTILQILSSDTLQMLLGFALLLIIARLVMRALNRRGKEQSSSATTIHSKLPPLPPMDIPRPVLAEYSASRGLGDGLLATPTLPEIPLSPEQRQKAAEWLEKHPL